MEHIATRRRAIPLVSAKCWRVTIGFRVPRDAQMQRSALRETMDTARRLQQAESISPFRGGIAEQIGSNVLSWFTQCRDPLYMDDLEGILDEGMLSLSVEVDDGSIEEVAAKLMIMHEECVEGNFRSIDLLREAELNQAAHPDVMQVVNDDDDDDNGDNNNGREDHVVGDDNSSNMMVDVSNFESHSKWADMSVKGHTPNVTDEAKDWWVEVSTRRNMGRKN